jgi:hypothetical protein
MKINTARILRVKPTIISRSIATTTPPPGVGDATHVLVFEEVWEFAQHFPDEEGGIFLGQCELPVVADAGDVAEGEGEA